MHPARERARLKARIEVNELTVYAVEAEAGIGRTQLNKILNDQLDITEPKIKAIDTAIDVLVAQRVAS